MPEDGAGDRIEGLEFPAFVEQDEVIFAEHCSGFYPSGYFEGPLKFPAEERSGNVGKGG